MDISRKKFISMSLAGISAVSHSLANLGRNDKPVAAVLEHLESKTRRALGAELMLKRAGFEVVRLTPKYLEQDLSTTDLIKHYGDKDLQNKVKERIKNALYKFPIGPDPQKIDLIFFGTFTNLGQPYHDYLRRYAKQIPEFVNAGGVIFEMSQWGRYSDLSPDFMPEGMGIVRETWSGTDEISVIDKNHPFIKKWKENIENVLSFQTQKRRPGKSYEGRRSWESIAEWNNMQVIMGAGGGYRNSDSGYPNRAALVEGEYGKGRYLFSSLWLDKLFYGNGTKFAEPETIQVAEKFFRSLYHYILQVKAGKAPHVTLTQMAPEPMIGPVLGHTDHEQSIIWIRVNKPGKYILRFWQESQGSQYSQSLNEHADSENDFCIHWRLKNLEADTQYCYSIEKDNKLQFNGQTFKFRTGPLPGMPTKVALAFGSCADQNGRFSRLWKQIEYSGVDGMVLLGDTPYVDSTLTAHQRLKHRHFMLNEGQAHLFQTIPFWGTWDDHDFGSNASDGRIHNRQGIRQGFKEYRPLTHYGENDEGVYTSFRRGPIEVFLLDLRYFAGTEPSFSKSDEPTLIGSRQWKWLKNKLESSDAPFKILAGGMTWDSKQAGGEPDDWERYSYEREAIIDFIGKKNISGVILVGGDIHCTQVMKYDTEDRIGYPLYHIVTSPMHNRVIREHETLQHPGLLFARAEPCTFLKVTADSTIEPGVLTMKVIDITGRCIYRLITDELSASVRP